MKPHLDSEYLIAMTRKLMWVVNGSIEKHYIPKKGELSGVTEVPVISLNTVLKPVEFVGAQIISTLNLRYSMKIEVNWK